MGLTILLTVFFLVGLITLLNGLIWMYKGRRSTSWPATDGCIIHSKLEKHTDSEGTTWNIKDRYSYCVDTKRYEGDRIAFDYISSSNSEHHQTLFAKLQTGSRVSVHYDPARPHKSVLTTGFSSTSVFAVAFSLIWLLVVTIFFLSRDASAAAGQNGCCD